MISSEVSFQFSVHFVNYIYNRSVGAEHYSQKYAGVSNGESLFWDCFQYRESSVSTVLKYVKYCSKQERSNQFSTPLADMVRINELQLQ